MNPTGVILSMFGAVACAILLGVAISADCGCHETQKHSTKQSHEKHHKKHKDSEENVYIDDTQSHGPHLSVLPIGPKLFGPFHLGF